MWSKWLYYSVALKKKSEPAEWAWWLTRHFPVLIKVIWLQAVRDGTFPPHHKGVPSSNLRAEKNQPEQEPLPLEVYSPHADVSNFQRKYFKRRTFILRKEDSLEVPGDNYSSDLGILLPPQEARTMTSCKS